MNTTILTQTEKDALRALPKEAAARELQRAESQLDTLTREKMAANGGLQYGQALKLVASERRELDETRTILIRRLH